MRCSSSCLVAVSGSAALLLIIIDRLPYLGKKSYMKHAWGEMKSGDAGACGGTWHTFEVVTFGFIMLALTAPLIAGLLAYIPARIFLVVEAFASLRDLPVEVYQTPNWTQLTPHL